MPARRESRLGFVQDIEAVSLEPVVEEGEEALSVGLFVKRLVSKAEGTCVFEITRHREEALGAQEKSITNPLGRADRANKAIERRVAFARAELVFPSTPLGIESPGHRQGFDQGRLARTVLADEEGDIGMECQAV